VLPPYSKLKREVEMRLKAVTGIMLTLFVVSIAFNVVPVHGSTQYIKIGVVGPKGWIQWDGLWEGAEMARDKINNAGGINISGTFYNIQLVDIDEHSVPTPDPAAAVSELKTKLNANPDMQFLIGGFRTECVGPMEEAAMDYVAVHHRPIWIIAGAAGDSLISVVQTNYARYKYMFRVTPWNSTVMVKTLANFIAQIAAPKLKALCSIAGNVPTYIIAENLAWADSWVAFFQANCSKYGMDYVGVSRPSPTATDFSPDINAATTAGAKIVIHIFSAVGGASFIKQYGTLKPNFTCIGINVESQMQEFYASVGGACEYEAFLAPVGTRTPIIPGVTDKFWDDYEARYGHSPIYTAWGAYDAIMALAETLGNPALIPTWPMTCDQLIPIIEQTDRTGILGRFKYTGPNGVYHDVFSNELGPTWTQSYVRPLVVQWQAGEMKVVWPTDQPYSKEFILPPWMVPTGPLYTLSINSLPTGVTFTVDGVSRTTPWSKTYGDGASVSLVMPETHDGYVWSRWLEDGDTSRIKTVTMNKNITLTAVYARTFDVVLDDIRYPVSILSNSTVSNFNFNQTGMQISFDVTGDSGIAGYCNVTIPKSLLTGNPWTIKIDDTPITDFDEKTNDTHTFLYFTYTHESPLQVTIEGKWVVPEFPAAIILPLFMLFTLIAVALAKKIRYEVIAKTT
jgi:branched-chain amino acid transport system substrate-binding protein